MLDACRDSLCSIADAQRRVGPSPYYFFSSDRWKDCPLVSIDPEVRHGEAVFVGTRMPVEGAIESVMAYRESSGLSEDRAIEATLHDHPTIPGAEALRSVLLYEAAREHLLAP